MPTIAERRQAFRQLHETGCFAIPNPWDIGSAKYLQHLEFKAIATTSAGFAFSRGLPDGAVKRDEMLAHIKAIVAAVAPKPVNILIGGAIGLTMKDAASLGARRVSVGGAFARAAWGGFIHAAKELIEKGTFDELANAASHVELQDLFRS